MPKTDANLYNSIDEFRDAAKDAAAPIPDGRIRASFDTEVKADDQTRTLTFTISTASVDRMGDTIAVSGWKLEAYRKNPVVLWAHDASMLPVAKAPKLWTESEKLKAEAEFTPLGMARFNDTVFEMYRQGFLNATSVGFMPLKYAFTDDPQRRYGIDFLEQELLEFSCVPVPANAEALIEGKAAGVDIVPVLEWAEDQVKRCGDTSRIIKLVDDILGSIVGDTTVIAWAQRVADANDLLIQSKTRVERIERAAKQKRLAEKRSRELELIRVRAG